MAQFRMPCRISDGEYDEKIICVLDNIINNEEKKCI